MVTPKPFLRPVRLLWLLAPLLIWWSLRTVPLAEVARALQNLHLWQIGLLLALNAAILLLFSARWWLILRAMGQAIPYLRLSAYRIAGFGVSYFTPGPQFGGEPLQVLILQRRHGLPASLAVSSVFLDKLIELLANFTFLVLGLAVIFLSGANGGLFGGWLWALVLGLLIFPLANLGALWRRRFPLTWLAGRLAVVRPRWQWLARLQELARNSEGQISLFFHQKPGALLQILAVSALSWLAVIFEYSLVLSFLGLQLNLAQSITALTAARLAFLLPLPGGLGALEASQVLAMQMLGLNPAVGISISVIIRARDVIVGAFGLWLGGWSVRL